MSLNMNELKDIITNYKALSNKIKENEEYIKKQKAKRSEYETKLIELMKRYRLTDKSIPYNSMEICYKSELKPCAISQGYLESSINSYFKKYNNGNRADPDTLYRYILDNRPKKEYERIYEKKSKR